MDINHKIRQARSVIDDANACEIYQTNSILEVSLSRGQCANDKNGACIMCDYGIASKSKPIKEYLQEMEQALKACGDTIRCLMLCTNGSIFNENQVERPLLEGALGLASKCSISRIELESHYLDVNSENLSMVKEKLKNKNIIIALGLETVNQEYQDLIIGKHINIIHLEEKIRLIKKFGFGIELNVMLGLPFLSPYEQFTDALDTLKWAYSHQCRPVLFPINIKPYTLLMEIYKLGQYTPVSHWMILLLLEQLTEEELAQIILVWYGNRMENYDDPALYQIPPTSCKECLPVIEKFYLDFETADSGAKRHRILKNTLHKSSCNCLNRVKSSLLDKSSMGFHERYIMCTNFFEKAGWERSFS
jgi:radical SAM enzyme (TIGR01210 family)